MRISTSPASLRSNRGISLIEVLISLAISMVIAAAMAGLFAQSVKSREQVDREGQRLESGRYALDAMADDIRLAGYYGGYMPRSSNSDPWPSINSALTTWTAPDPCATTLAGQGWANTGTINVPVAVFGYEAGHATGTPAGLPTCLPNYKAGTDVIVTRRTSTMVPSATAGTSAPATTAAMTANAVYLQASNCSTQTPRFVVGDTAASFTMQNLGCSAAALATLRQVMVRIYFIATCNNCSPSDSTPTLKVVELMVPSSSSDVVYHKATDDWASNRAGTLAMGLRVLAPGIENMHFEYGVDGSTDAVAGSGSADSYVAADGSPTATTPFGWQNVMSVKVWVLARDFDRTGGYQNTRTYSLGSASISANDDYRRNVFASTVRVVNPAGAREIP